LDARELASLSMPRDDVLIPDMMVSSGTPTASELRVFSGAKVGRVHCVLAGHSVPRIVIMTVI